MSKKSRKDRLRERTSGARKNPYREQAQRAKTFHWEDLNGLHREVRSLIDSHTSMAEVVTVTQNTDLHTTTTQIWETVSRDCASLTERADAVQRTHAHRTGPVTNPDELSASLDMYENYQAISNDFQMVVFPQLERLRELTTPTPAAEVVNNEQ